LGGLKIEKKFVLRPDAMEKKETRRLRDKEPTGNGGKELLT